MFRPVVKAGHRNGIGIIGTGFGVATHHPAWSDIEGARVMGFAGRDAAHASEVSHRFGLPITGGTAEALLASADVDIVVVAVPPGAQAPLIEAALESGKHDFAEKPLALDVGTASRLVEMAERKGLRHGVNFCLRQARASLLLKQAMTEGRIGEPRRVVVTWHRGHRARKDLEWNWKCDATQGGGVMNSHGVPILDLLMWLFADVLDGRCVRQINIPRRRDSSGRERDVTAEDALSATLSFVSGVTAVVSLDSTAVGGSGLSIDVFGSHGSLHMWQTAGPDPLSGLNVAIVDVQGRTETLLEDVDAKAEGQVCLVKRLAHEFVKSVRERTPFSPDFSDGARVISASGRLQFLAAPTSVL